MTTDPICCLADDRVYAVAQQMQNENIGSLPVIESHQDKTLIGVITDRDLALRVVGASRDSINTTVKDVMTSQPLFCYANDDLDTTLEVMAHHQIRRMPCVDENNQVVGIIAQADIVIHLKDHQKVGAMMRDISQPDSQ